MATDSVLGLFATPEQLQQQQYNAVLDRNMRLAQLTPIQEATARLGTSAYMLGGAIGGALGAQDPALQRQTLRSNILKSLNPADPKSWQQAISQANQSGDGELSSFLLGKYKETADIAQKQSVAEKNAKYEKQQVDAATKRDLIATVEDQLSRNETVDPVTLNKAKLAFGDISRPKTMMQSDGSIAVIPPSVDASMFPNIGKVLGKSTTTGGVMAGGGVAPVLETPTSIEAKTRDVNAAESAVRSIDSSISTLDELKTLRKNRDWTTNPWVADKLAGFPTQARTQQNLVKSQIADKVIGIIGEMKQQSKTGATGFGALNLTELQKLEDTVRRLDPIDPNFDKDIEYVYNKLLENKKIIQGELSRKKEKLNTATGKQSPMSGKNPQLQPTEESWIEKAMAKNPGFSRAQVIQEGIKAGKLPADYQ